MLVSEGRWSAPMVFKEEDKRCRVRRDGAVEDVMRGQKPRPLTSGLGKRNPFQFGSENAELSLFRLKSSIGTSVESRSQDYLRALSIDLSN